MRFIIISLCTVAIMLMGYTGFRPNVVSIDKEAVSELIKKKRLTMINCSPDWTTYNLSKEEVQSMMPLPGTGSHSWKISTGSDSAQFYFNQGMNLYYGFHILEAMPSFKKAQTFDPECAMLYWAEALGYGPNINDMGYAASPDALNATKRSLELSGKASSKEKALIDAMQVRYSSDSTEKREILNQRYADKMKALHIKYFTDAEIGALYADALMVQHPWELWYHDGRPRPWTPQIQTVLEKVLKYSPNHPGANHYYIHTMEASPFAYKAIQSADRLGNLTPGLAHMVHMPSHIYIRTGQYEKGQKVNVAAIESYNIYKKLYPDVANGAFLYEIHNRHMQAANSINRNDYKQALKDAIEARTCFDTSILSMDPPFGGAVQYVYMTPLMVMVTFEKWQQILNEPDVESRHHYSLLLQHFARGMAYANMVRIADAKNSLMAVEELLSEKDLAVVLSPFNAPITGARVAKYILSGMIAEKENRLSTAIDLYRKGVITEDSLIYNEPRDWLVPARHYLGNALVKARRFNEAQQVFKADLRVQPKNYISMVGLTGAMSR